MKLATSLLFLTGLLFLAKAQDNEGTVFEGTASLPVTSWASWDDDGTSISKETTFLATPTWPAGTNSESFSHWVFPTVPPIPPAPTAIGVPAATPNVVSGSSSNSGKHHTLAIVLPTILSILGAVALAIGLVLFNRRSREAAVRRRRSWFNANKWVPDRKEMVDLERHAPESAPQDISTPPPAYQGRN
jgi:hypothetical protein